MLVGFRSSLCLRLALLCSVVTVAVLPTGCIGVEYGACRRQPAPGAAHKLDELGRKHSLDNLERRLYHLLLKSAGGVATAGRGNSITGNELDEEQAAAAAAAEKLTAALDAEETGEDLVRIRFG